MENKETFLFTTPLTINRMVLVVVVSTLTCHAYQLEEPIFEEKGRITAQKEIGGHKTQMTFSYNGTFKG
jgi:hypothetical protein